jgi:hypothetical protein
MTIMGRETPWEGCCIAITAVLHRRHRGWNPLHLLERFRFDPSFVFLLRRHNQRISSTLPATRRASNSCGVEYLLVRPLLTQS